jgi:hypothetical protein
MNMFPWYGIGVTLAVAALLGYVIYRLNLRVQKKYGPGTENIQRQKPDAWLKIRPRFVNLIRLRPKDK